MTACNVEIGLAPEAVIEQRNTKFHEGFVHVIRTCAVMVVTGVPGTQRTHAGEAAVHKRIGTGLVHRGRGRSRYTARIGVGALAVMLFTIFVTQSHRDRTRPVFDRRTIDREAEGFLTLGHGSHLDQWSCPRDHSGRRNRQADQVSQ